MMISRFGMTIALATCVALAACSGKGPEPLPEDTAVETPVDESVPTVVEEPDEALPPANITNTAKALPPPEVPDEEQIRDDADATGLTARLPEDTGAAADNATAPVN
jgi:predicted small lipoprotein YifL